MKLDASFKKRRRFKAGGPRKYVYEKRSFTREQLVEYLRTKQFTSRNSLTQGRKAGEPSAYDYEKEFGTWENARSSAFGIKLMDLGFNKQSIIDAILKFDLWSYQRYKAKRKEYPEVFPPMYRVIQVCGRWADLIDEARYNSFKVSIDAYGALARKLGKVPTLEEAKEHGVGIEAAVAYYKGKSELDKLISLWKDKNEGKTRGS